MQKILDAIEDYNKVSNEIFIDEDGYNTILADSLATDADITKFEKNTGIQLPHELREFYTTLGKMQNKNNFESYCFEIFPLEKLEEIASPSSPSDKIGLIEMILYSWGGDRHEFTSGEFFTEEQLQKINSTYKCFGWYRDDHMLDAAHYLYFSTNGGFNKLYYNQDNFEACEEKLKELLKNTSEPAPKTLEEILLEGLAKTKEIMIDWNS